MFQLTKEEFENWKSQIATSNSIVMGARKRPYAFTEQGVAMYNPQNEMLPFHKTKCSETQNEASSL
jgi:hypothetical protein